MSLSWFKEIQQVPINKPLMVPLNLMNMGLVWTSDSLPKRGALLEVFTKSRERLLISRIAIKAKTDVGKIYFKVVVLKDCFNLAEEDHLDKFKQILLSIDLESIYFINSEYSDYLRQSSTNFADLKNVSAKNVSNSDHEIHMIKKCGTNEIAKIIAHLQGHSKEDVTDDEMAKVESFIEHGFNLYPEYPSYAELLNTHSLTKAWFRKELPVLDDDTFPSVLKTCIETIFEDDNEVKEDQLSAHWYLAAHALCESHKTKEAQQVKDSHKKKEQAFYEWKTNYQGKTKKERKASKTSLRSISSKVGISVGTLSNWIKEFKRTQEAKQP